MLLGLFYHQAKITELIARLDAAQWTGTHKQDEQWSPSKANVREAVIWVEREQTQLYIQLENRCKDDPDVLPTL